MQAFRFCYVGFPFIFGMVLVLAGWEPVPELKVLLHQGLRGYLGLHALLKTMVNPQRKMWSAEGTERTFVLETWSLVRT